MSYRNVSRIGLVLVVLGVSSVAFWWLRGGAPEAGERESAKPAATAAERALVSRVSSDVSDRSDTSDKAATVAPATPTTSASAPQPAAPLTAAAEGLVAPIPTGVQDHYTKNEVLDERVGEVGPDGQYERVRIVKTSMKYPLVRVEERFQVSGVRGESVQSSVFSVQNPGVRSPESQQPRTENQKPVSLEEPTWPMTSS